MFTRTTRVAAARGLAALLAVVMFKLPAARGAPADIFTMPAPVIGADAPKAAELKAGEMSVSTATGAAGYSYPIAVPSGRNGMAPKLALVYSSQGPTYGGVAAGWTLPIGMIREDTSNGRLRTHDVFIEHAQGAARDADDEFVSTVAGESRLVPSGEPLAAGVSRTYRVAYNDASFARYERMNVGQLMHWRVRTSDGTTMLFGEKARTPGCPISDGYAPLTSVVDAFGNEVAYQYVMSRGECMIDRITWGQNAAAGLAMFAEVQFVVVPYVFGCDSNISIGSQTSYRTGEKIVTGANEITQIVVRALDPASGAAVHTRTVNLGYQYTGVCGLASGRQHLLTSIQESASGTDSPLVTLPAVSFEYGDPVVNLSTLKSQGNPMLDCQLNAASCPVTRPSNLGWGFRRTDDRWPTIEAMMLDVDGDGLPGSADQRLDAERQRPMPRALAEKPRPEPGQRRDPIRPRHRFDHAAAPQVEEQRRDRNDELARLRSLLAQRPDHGLPQLDRAIEQLLPRRHRMRARHKPERSDAVLRRRHRVPAWARRRAASVPQLPRLSLDRRRRHGLPDLVTAIHGDSDWYNIDYGNFPIAPEPPPFGAWPACPGTMDRCRELDATARRTRAAATCAARIPPRSTPASPRRLRSAAIT